MKCLTLMRYCMSVILQRSVATWVGLRNLHCRFLTDFLFRTKTWVTKSYKPLLKISQGSNSPPTHWWMLSLVIDHLGSTGSVLFKLLPCVLLSTFSPLPDVVIGALLKFSSLTFQGACAIGSVLVLSQLLHALLKLF